jgi:hypothetical protein
MDDQASEISRAAGRPLVLFERNNDVVSHRALLRILLAPPATTLLSGPAMSRSSRMALLISRREQQLDRERRARNEIAAVLQMEVQPSDRSDEFATRVAIDLGEIESQPADSGALRTPPVRARTLRRTSARPNETAANFRTAHRIATALR